ncbi:MAG: TrkH family potassium uptake protein [Lentisphaerae bacterium]|nr:TrkH family potassium uptake protein [Lentisphaerota bacterium]
MRLRPVLHLVSYLLMVVAVATGLCWLVSVHADDPAVAQQGLSQGALLGFLIGAAIWIFTRGPVNLTKRDGFGIVTFGWIGVTITGALPYILSGVIPDPVSAIFETMSGFTTTGSTVLTNLESIPKGILFWRSLTQWLGGMGVLVLCVAILPFLGVGGMQIYRAEIPGPSKDRLTPRIASTAKLLWGLYLLISVAQTLLLMLGGMDWFDACCHTFTTMSTGGFSTRTASVAAFDSVYIEIVIIVFMFLAGANFSLHYRALRGQPIVFLRDPEFRFYALVWFASCLIISFNVWHSAYDSAGTALRAGFFQGTSIMTTTGYCTEDFNLWPAASRFLLVLLMFVGGCGGSTGGGVKAVRCFVVLKKIGRELQRVMRPQAAVRIRLGSELLSDNVVSNIAAFVIIFVGVFALASLVMTFYTPDLVTATSSVAATLGNIGPGLAAVGATETYAFIPAPGKLVLTLCMLLGRLELYTVLVLLLPSFWRK